ncbi:hypothetical protein D7D52_23285 [Nocardia yunnanensis]|uniref:Hemophore-related protein n=1 Tax=Nocardia yunnanensis TaxID=2382165 RepID=A0A386ZI64_9NOCA|nr:hypothetical protein [Nocardia yunnanensis]AYF76265.1 hypothetical protein D7D52_23285 [Nocardia yunnanensis]
MRKILPSAVLAAGAVAALLVLPAGNAYALSPACQAASDVLNSYGSLGPSPQQMQDAANRLYAIDASGQEQMAISNYANALAKGDVAMIGNAAPILNGICAQTN